MADGVSRHHHLGRHASFDWQQMRSHIRDVETLGLGRYRQLNAKIAVVATHLLGSMEFFWGSNLLALLSLPAVLAQVAGGLHTFFPAWLIKVSLIALVSWVAQTYIQLVALSVLQVSGNAQAQQLETSVKTILDWMSLDTEGGAQEIMTEVRALREAIVGSRVSPPAKPRSRTSTRTRKSE